LTWKVVAAAVTFSINPFNAGHIECGKDRVIAPAVQQFYIWSGSECTAKPNQGFDFVSWQENLGGNSREVIQFASSTDFYEPILDFFHIAPDKPEAILNITKFGILLQTLGHSSTSPTRICDQIIYSCYYSFCGNVASTYNNRTKESKQRRV
jgi:hypothetical protein